MPHHQYQHIPPPPPPDGQPLPSYHQQPPPFPPPHQHHPTQYSAYHQPPPAPPYPYYPQHPLTHYPLPYSHPLHFPQAGYYPPPPPHQPPQPSNYEPTLPPVRPLPPQQPSTLHSSPYPPPDRPAPQHPPAKHQRRHDPAPDPADPAAPPALASAPLSSLARNPPLPPQRVPRPTAGPLPQQSLPAAAPSPTAPHQAPAADHVDALARPPSPAQSTASTQAFPPHALGNPAGLIGAPGTHQLRLYAKPPPPPHHRPFLPDDVQAEEGGATYAIPVPMSDFTAHPLILTGTPGAIWAEYGNRQTYPCQKVHISGSPLQKRHHALGMLISYFANHPPPSTSSLCPNCLLHHLPNRCPHHRFSHAEYILPSHPVCNRCRTCHSFGFCPEQPHWIVAYLADPPPLHQPDDPSASFAAQLQAYADPEAAAAMYSSQGDTQGPGTAP